MAREAQRRRIRALIQLAGIEDGDLRAIERAFVHESAARETGAKSNERLEFLGDHVLGEVLHGTSARTTSGNRQSLGRRVLVPRAALEQLINAVAFDQGA